MGKENSKQRPDNQGTTIPTDYDFHAQCLGYLQRYERLENAAIGTAEVASSGLVVPAIVAKSVALISRS
jgi:hypothetical protein